MLAFAVLPFILAFFSFIFWYIIRLVKPYEYKDVYLRNFLTTIFVFIFLIHPTIMAYSFSMFNCIVIEGVSYLERDLSIKCWESSHIKMLTFFTLPTLIVWVFGYPIMMFILLLRNRKNLNNNATIIKYGLYYIGLKDEAFYW